MDVFMKKVISGKREDTPLVYYSYKELTYFGSPCLRNFLRNNVIQGISCQDYLDAFEKLLPFKFKELKIIVNRNKGFVKRDKRAKSTWIYAYIDIVLSGFNTFAVVSQLNDDLLLEIRKFL